MTALARAVAATRERPSLWIVALGGFLARGGIVVLSLPLVPVPSTVGMATFVGPTSVTAAGLTADSVARIALLVGVVVGWLVVGNGIGAVTDFEIVGGHAAGARPILRLVGIRLLALLPVIAVVAITARSVGELVYQELILPSDIAAPIVVRVVQGAQLQVGAIVLAWIAGEVLGGIAVRLAILEDRSVGRAIAGSLAFVVRQPLTTLAATAAGLVVLIVAIAPGLVAIGVAWSMLGAAVSGTIDGPAVVRATIVVVAAWAASALVAAIGAEWRGELWTVAVAPSGRRR